MHTDKLTTKCHICQHTWKQGGLMCGIWDWQSTIVKDLNDSQDPKHTLFCRENAFVAIYARFSDNKCLLFTRLGRGVAKSGYCLLFFTGLSRMMASLSESCLGDLIEQSGYLVSTLFKVCLCFWVVLLSLYHAILDGISDSGPEKQLWILDQTS